MNTQLKTLMLAFVGIPIMTHIVALVLLTLFDLINSICNGMNDEFNSPEKSFLLWGVLLLGGLDDVCRGGCMGKKMFEFCVKYPLALLFNVATSIIVANYMDSDYIVCPSKLFL